MKSLVTSFNKKLGTNPMAGRLLDALPIERAGANDCEVVFFSFIAPECDFDLDLTMLEIVSRRGVPVVVFDHSETFPKDLFIGCSSTPEGSRYFNIHKWLTCAKVKAYFKRELLSGSTVAPGLSFPVYPLDWTLEASAPAKVDSREEYNARPIDIFYCFGYSNESRPRLMGELLKQAGRFNAHWCLTDEDLDRALAEKRERIFALLFTPHYRRIHFSKIFAWQQQAKVSVSMFGAGMKCFRCAEASYNSVMAQQAPHVIEWSYPWQHNHNCLGLAWGGLPHTDGELVEPEEARSVEWLYQALRVTQGSLYDIYRKGIENNERYHNNNYANNYLWPKIKDVIK